MDISKLSPKEQIEYYLGKDRLPNIHWKKEIPSAWSIIPRATFLKLCNENAHNVTITLDSVEYYLNNLGYRSNFDFVVDELKNKDVILVLGDSDTSGRGISFEDMYSTRMQLKSDACVVNLGVPGLSADGMSRIGVKTLLALGTAVKHVCVFWPVASLREFVSKKFNNGVHTSLVDSVPYKDWWDHIDWVSNNYNYQKNRILLEQATLNAEAKYHDLMINRYDKDSAVTYITLDDGFTELSAESHSAIANYFLRKINNQPSLFQEMQS